MDPEQAKRIKQLEAELAKSKEREAAQAKRVKREALLRELDGLKSEEYLKLAPEVKFGEDGKFTAETKEALDKFRADHSELFEPPKPGTTPRGKGRTRSDLSDEDAQTLARMRMSTELPSDHPYSVVVGYETPVRSHRGGGSR